MENKILNFGTILLNNMGLKLHEVKLKKKENGKGKKPVRRKTRKKLGSR